MTRTSALLIAGVLAVSAAASAPREATAQEACIDPGLDVPVVLVHGWGETAAFWSERGTALLDHLEAAPSTIVDVFEYDPVGPVALTDDVSGAALADRISCLAEASDSRGGLGKVVLVTHSSGLLIAERAVVHLQSEHGHSSAIASIVAIAPSGSQGFSLDEYGAEGIADAEYELFRERAEIACTIGEATYLSSLCARLAAIERSGTDVDGLPPAPTGADQPPIHPVLGHITMRTSVFGRSIAVGDVGDGMSRDVTTEWREAGADVAEPQTYSCLWNLIGFDGDSSCYSGEFVEREETLRVVSQALAGLIVELGSRGLGAARQVDLRDDVGVTVRYCHSMEVWVNFLLPPGSTVVSPISGWRDLRGFGGGTTPWIDIDVNQPRLARNGAIIDPPDGSGKLSIFGVEASIPAGARVEAGEPIGIVRAGDFFATNAGVFNVRVAGGTFDESNEITWPNEQLVARALGVTPPQDCVDVSFTARSG